MSQLDPRLRVWRWRVFAATWFGYIGYYMCRKPFYIAKASLGDAVGLDASMLGVIGSAYLAAYAVGQVTAGLVGNKVGPRLLVLVGLAITIGVNIAFGFTNSWAGLTALMAVNGLAQASGWPGNVGSIAPWYGRHERGTVMGFWSTNFQVGGVAANALASFVLGLYGYQYAFFAGSLVAMLIWVNFLINQRNRPEDVGLEPLDVEEDEASNGGPAGWSRQMIVNILIVGCFYFCVKFIRYALWSWAPYILNQRYGLAPDDAGYVSTIFDLSGISGVIFIGFLSDRFFKARRAKVSFLFMALLVLACTALYTVGQSGVVLFAVCMGVIGFSLYGPDALMTGAGAIDVASPRGATLAAGLINGMGSVGPIVQELVLGRLLDSHGVGAVFGVLLAAAIGGICALGVLLLRNRRGLADV